MAAQERDELSPLQNAIYLLKQSQAKLAAYERSRSEPIAIIGVGCRFPGGATNPETFWKLVASGVDAVREVPADRWNIDDWYDPDPSTPGKMSTRWGGFLDHVDEFDCEFFGISPREAVRVDPQHRLLLEVAWEALEDAGLPPADIAQTRTGVYVGVIGSDYALMQSKDLFDMDVFSGTGSSHAILANRLSYVLNLNGPSIALDTACSSSLVTIHLACQSLRRRESDLALVGGVNLMLSPEMTMALTKAHMMAPDGRCKTFDASADGYVRGEGCGMIVIKRLSDALAAGDRIIALIRGSAVNHDGRSNGLSAPNGPAQEAVIRAALADGQLAPTDIDYIEAHGTGTRLGDPIEIEALRCVLGEGRTADQHLLVGSVKTNIGHLESAAGIAGLVKIILMLRHGQVPPHLHLHNVNPLLRLEDSPIDIPTSLRDWRRGSHPRRAAVSSFGFGGTNAHVIVEEPPLIEPLPSAVERPRHLVALSARSEQALTEVAERYADFAQSHPAASLANIGHTANAGRTHFSYRAAVVAASVEELHSKLQQFPDDPPATGVHKGFAEHDRPPRIAFLFTGQGAQYAGMGRALYETQPTFRAALDRCAVALQSQLDRPLLELLEPDTGTLLDQTGYTQPVMFALEFALAELWRSWGIEPTAVLGHSVGEFAAACVAGVFSLEDGLRLIAQRARLMQSLPSGGVMAAVFATAERVTAALEAYAGQLSIAAINGPESIVISGDQAAVQAVLSRFEAEGVNSKLLATSHAFHSYRMDPILDSLRQVAASVTYSAPRIDIVANLTGQVADQQTYADPGYWSCHARSPVQFAQSVKALAERGCELFLEIGPSPILIGMGQRCLAEGNYAWLPSLRPGRDDWQTLLDSLGELYVHGANVDWKGFDRDYSRQRIELPTYPFQRRRYWARTAVNVTPGLSMAQQDGRSVHPLVGHRLVAAVGEQIFENQLAANRPTTLADHKIQGIVVMPGSAYLEMAMAASAAVHGKPWTIRGMSLLEPLILEKTPKTVQTILTPEGPNAASFRVVSVIQSAPEAEPSFVTHVVARLELPTETESETIDVEAMRARFSGEPRDQQWQIDALHKSGLEPGPTFCWNNQHWMDGVEGLAEVREPREGDRAGEFYAHPGLIDSMFQLVGALLPGAGTGIDAYVPMSIDRLQFFDRHQGPGYFFAKISRLDANFALDNVELFDSAGRVLMKIEGLRLRRVPRDWLARLVSGPLPDWCYELAWAAQPLSAPTAEQSPTEPGHWLIFDSQEGLGSTLAEGLTAKGQHCQQVASGGDPESRRTAVREFLQATEPGRRGIVYLGSLDVDGRTDCPDLDAARRNGWGGALDIVQAASGAGSAGGTGSASGTRTPSGNRQPPRLWLVTRGAQAVGDSPLALSLAQSPLWGLARVIAAEHPELNCTRIDLDPQDRRAAAEQLLAEIWAGSTEDQVAYRAGERHVARLRHLRRGDAGALEIPRGQPYRLEITSRGELDHVALRPMVRQQPGPGQVEIQVRATGLNFRDVLNVLNLYPGDPGPLGGECAGQVVAVGAGVERFKPGDQVVALAPASFASYTLTLSQFVAPKPEHLSFEEAATIPICFLTTYYSLCRLGALRQGQRVLIHAASGGVGLSAIQIAKRVGAEIFATAGSPRKREYLKSLGIEHVFDSRSLDFKDAILQATGGEGIDLVVNSLTGDAIAASLSLLRPGGHFLELGKTDLWDQRRVDELRPGITFHAIALDRMMAEQPDLVQQIMGEVLPQFVEKQLQPLPLRTFGIRRVVDALRHMARAEHIGKVVIQAATDNDLGKAAFVLRDNATYLVTGGLGGLGLKVARWLVDRGARHLVLLGRSGVSEEARPQIESLRAGDVHVEVRKCDVANRSALAAVLAEIAGQMPPLGGVFHLAGVLDDGVLRDQTRERFDRVMAAKVLGAWNLHDLTRQSPLDHFVLFSSAAALLGSPGQGNYAAANAFLDALAHHRRAEKLPALSVNWGSWADVGMAARLKDAEGRRWSAAGVGWIEPPRGLETLEQLILGGRAQAGVLPIDWRKFFERIPTGSEPAWLLDIARDARTADSPQESGPPVLLEKLKSVTPAERLEVALNFIRQQAARVLAMDDANLPDPRRTLNEVGFDSLTGVEFCNRVGRSVGQHLNPAMLFDYPTLETFAAYVVGEVLHLETESGAQAPAAKPEEAADEAQQQVLADVESMSEEEMDALVTQQLDKLQP